MSVRTGGIEKNWANGAKIHLGNTVHIYTYRANGANNNLHVCHYKISQEANDKQYTCHDMGGLYGVSANKNEMVDMPPEGDREPGMAVR